MFSRSWRKPVALAVLLGFLPFASGVLRLVQPDAQGLPVQQERLAGQVAALADVPRAELCPSIRSRASSTCFFANAWEFWAGSNPITAQLEPQTVVGPNGEVASLIPVENGARIVVTEPSGAVHTATLLREAPGVVRSAVGLTASRRRASCSSCRRWLAGARRYWSVPPRQLSDSFASATELRGSLARREAPCGARAAPFSSTTLPSGSRRYIDGP